MEAQQGPEARVSEVCGYSGTFPGGEWDDLQPQIPPWCPNFVLPTAPPGPRGLTHPSPNIPVLEWATQPPALGNTISCTLIQAQGPAAPWWLTEAHLPRTMQQELQQSPWEGMGGGGHGKGRAYCSGTHPCGVSPTLLQSSMATWMQGTQTSKHFTLRCLV